MKLIHYTSEEFDLEQREYELKIKPNGKPNGLWVSVVGECDWKEWCESEEFRLDRLAVAYEVKLKENNNVLFIDSPAGLINVNEKYPREIDEYTIGALDWTKMRGDYQGIIIAPYQFELRFAWMWYYCWDCASGCIWDLSCIDEFNLIASGKVDIAIN